MLARILANPGALVGAVVGPVRRRVEENCARRGLLFPWWIPVVSLLGYLLCGVVALSLRDQLWPPAWPALTLVMLGLPAVVQVGAQVWIPTVFEASLALGAAAWLMSVPVQGPTDVAPAILMIATAEAVSTAGLLLGGMVGISSLVLIVVTAATGDLQDQYIHVLDVLLGFLVGAMLRTQMRALLAEQAARAGVHERATLAERQRIAREIHDLVAHSLSVTLLHITGARQALRDGEHAEVDEALVDAEQVGRQAMADIRRTVSTLADAGPTGGSVSRQPRQPLPDATDIGALVQQLRDAGMALVYEETGDPSTLPPAAGLGLYRVVQESLTNVARHAPGATAAVRLEVGATKARVLVRNPMPARPPRSDGLGHGVPGMQARAVQLGASLRAGRDGDDWLVELRLPLRGQRAEPSCPMAGSVLPRRSQADPA